MVKLFQQLDQLTKDIKFFEANHTYEHKTKKKLTSVTTVLKGLSKPFETEYWSVYKALQSSGYEVKSDKKRGVCWGCIQVNGKNRKPQDIMSDETIKWIETPEKMQQNWTYLANVGTTRGTMIHNYLEDLWRGKYMESDSWGKVVRLEDMSEFDQSVLKMKRQANDFYNEHQHLVPISLEQIVGDEILGVAGQIDGVFYDTIRECYCIYDYKTDKKIEYKNQWEKFKHPIDHLDNCEYNKYSLQIALYKELIERHTDIVIEDSYVIWFNHHNESYQKIHLQDFTDEARTILASSKEGKIIID